jgi:hypothetical protein
MSSPSRSRARARLRAIVHLRWRTISSSRAASNALIEVSCWAAKIRTSRRRAASSFRVIRCQLREDPVHPLPTLNYLARWNRVRIRSKELAAHGSGKDDQARAE